MPEFYPPQLTLPLVRAVQLLAPWVAYLAYRVELEIDADSLSWLTKLHHQRVLLLANHPTFQDPIVLFLLSARLGQAFYYLSAQELFQSRLGPFFQRMGVYSIQRGGADRASIAQTLELLSQPTTHLVIFPEGGCSFQNDTVIPFRVGGIQIALQALNRLVKQGQPPPDLYVVPIGIKYYYTQSMTPVIERSLTRLEQALEIPTPTNYNEDNGKHDYRRLRAIAAQVLTRIEQEYGISTSEPSWNQRITALKAHVLTTCEQQLGLTSAAGELDRERVYRIQNLLQSQADALTTSDGTGGLALEAMQKAMFRVLNFDAIYDGYVASNPTPERFLDTVIRLEREVFDIDQPPPKGHRQASVRVGEPLNLKDWFANYQRDRAGTIADISSKIQQTVQDMLDLLNSGDLNRNNW